ncbi:hypothetical protein ABFX02_10G108800 [Erythranthe guttata]
MKIEDKLKSKMLPTMTIHECAQSGNVTGFVRLLRHDPSLLNQTSPLMVQTPLHYAASLDRLQIVAYLIGWGGPGKLELEAKNVYGETPLHVAAKNGCNETLKLLLDYSAYIEATTNKSMTPLHLAVGYALGSGDNTTVKILLQYNANRSAKDNEGMIPFNYLPAGLQNEELIRLLKVDVPNLINNFTSEQMFYNTNTTGYSSYQNNNPVNNNCTPQYNKTMEQIYSTIGISLPGNPSLSSSSHFNNIMEQYNSSTTGDLINLEINCSTSSTPVQQINLVSTTNDYNGIEAKMDEFDNEMSKIVGLNDLKLQLNKWAKGILMDEKRRAMGINLGPKKPPHMAFLGNPGTGKTTVARILGKLLKSVGVLSSDKVIEVQRTDLVGEYIGQTGPKTRKKIEEAMGGILFVDEAYRLAPVQGTGHCQDLGVEALEEIMSVLEDGNLVIIFAGYTDDMKRVFSSNAGFCRRVTHFFQFDDFTCKDLAEMLMIKMSKQDENSRFYGFKLHPSCTCGAVLAVIERNSTEKLRNKLNGSLVDIMLNNARENLDSRLNFNSYGEELLTITLGDLEAGLKTLSQRVNVVD